MEMLYEIVRNFKQKESQVVCAICKNDGKLARSSKGIYEFPADEVYREDWCSSGGGILNV
jgi:hypothetical protein